MMKNWTKDIAKEKSLEMVIQEMHGRIRRLATSNGLKDKDISRSAYSRDISQVEKIAIYKAQNYARPIRVEDIGNCIVGAIHSIKNACFFLHSL